MYRIYLPRNPAPEMLVILAWLVTHSYDASNWFNRNQAIITNIERQFLKKSDLTEIHPYFGEHRKVGDMLRHVRIQQMLGVAIAVIMLLYHLFTELVPGLEGPWCALHFAIFLPIWYFCFPYLECCGFERRHGRRIQTFRRSPRVRPSTSFCTLGARPIRGQWCTVQNEGLGGVRLRAVQHDQDQQSGHHNSPDR